MKCPNCGYEQGYTWVDGEGLVSNYIEINPTGKKFINVQGTFLVDNDNYHGSKHEVYLFACPECKVIQLGE